MDTADLTRLLELDLLATTASETFDRRLQTREDTATLVPIADHITAILSLQLTNLVAFKEADTPTGVEIKSASIAANSSATTADHLCHPPTDREK